jgi:hypothetical protein
MAVEDRGKAIDEALTNPCRGLALPGVDVDADRVGRRFR